MFTIVNDKYGYGEYSNLDDIIEQARDLDYGELYETPIWCDCGEIIEGLMDGNDEIVAVETAHVNHSAW
jgi:hypothetical protein